MSAAEAWLEGRDVSEGASRECRQPRLEAPPSHSLPTIYATLSCGHDILWDDPDEDVNGSHYCPKCGGYFRVESFR